MAELDHETGCPERGANVGWAIAAQVTPGAVRLQRVGCVRSGL